MIKVFSMSEVNTWIRCRKKYEFEYIMRRTGTSKSEALEKGSSLHKFLEEACKGNKLVNDGSEMYVVAKEYLARNGLPKDIRYVESPFYFLLSPGVYLRCTADVVHIKDQALYIRDWKSFSLAPSYNHELDFQAKTYAAFFSTVTSLPVMFEHVYIRTTPPDVPHDKKGNKWTDEECYICPTPVLFSKDEMDAQRMDVLDAVREIMSEPRYRRSPLKGGGYDACDRCNVKALCTIESYKGKLDDFDLLFHSKSNDRVKSDEDLAKEFTSGMTYNLELEPV